MRSERIDSQKLKEQGVMTMAAILDQSSNATAVASSGAVSAACNRRIAQTYVASVSGTLVSVYISVRPSAGSAPPLRVAIHAVQDGQIAPVVLGSTLLSTNSAMWAQPIVFAVGVYQDAGKQYAIVADYPGGSSDSMFTWSASTANTDSNRVCLVSAKSRWSAQPVETVCDFQIHLTDVLDDAQMLGRTPVQTEPGTGGSDLG